MPSRTWNSARSRTKRRIPDRRGGAHMIVALPLAILWFGALVVALLDGTRKPVGYLAVGVLVAALAATIRAWRRCVSATARGNGDCRLGTRGRDRAASRPAGDHLCDSLDRCPNRSALVRSLARCEGADLPGPRCIHGARADRAVLYRRRLQLLRVSSRSRWSRPT